VDLDSLRTGRLATAGRLAPFCVDRLERFSAEYTDRGQAIGFAADITYSRGVSGLPRRHTVTVNHPLRLDGDRLYLTGHGFAPRLTVRMPDGTVRTTTTTLLPRDALMTSEGAVKLQGSRSGRDIGIEGVFAPTGVENGGILTSGSPQPLQPALAIFIYQGDLGLRLGVPQSVYSLDTPQKATGALRRIGTATLTPGQSKQLAGGVRVTFDGYTQWVNFQISHNPGQNYLLLAAAGMVTGLLGSLAIRRRRIWLRLTPQPTVEEPTRVAMDVGGLARSDSGNFTTEFSALLAHLRTALTAPAHEPSLEGADR
jgi:cytochrome c biogenesis protein